MSPISAAARRDQSFHLHPSTNLRAVLNDGPLVITRGDGVYVWELTSGTVPAGLAFVRSRAPGLPRPAVYGIVRSVLRIVDDPDLKTALAVTYARTGARYLADAATNSLVSGRQAKIVDSGQYLIEHGVG